MPTHEKCFFLLLFFNSQSLECNISESSFLLYQLVGWHWVCYYCSFIFGIQSSCTLFFIFLLSAGAFSILPLWLSFLLCKAILYVLGSVGD